MGLKGINVKLRVKNFLSKVNIINSYLEEKDGYLLDVDFETDKKRTILKLKCKNNHFFSLKIQKLTFAKQWCSKCAKLHILNIEDMKILAEARGGKCLSDSYSNARKNLLWECSLGHQWLACADSVKNNGTWCGKCNISISEEICRVYFETIFNKKFPCLRPDWCLNPLTNYKLELDGYCEELNIAFEHNGADHFNNSGRFNPGILYRDEKKKELCEKNNTKLFIINELFQKTKLDDLLNEICKQAKKLNVEMNSNLTNIKFDISVVYTTNSFYKYEGIANLKGGKIIKESYINSYTKCSWECRNGHKWDTTPNSIQNGHWCWKCAHNPDVHEFAKIKNGYCLSKEFVNKNTKLIWKCDSNHIWNGTYSSAKRTWCKKCNEIERSKNRL